MADSSWREFFDAYAPRYMDEAFTRNTRAEVDFLVEVLGLTPGAAVLDVGCGAGRHSVELARRGFRVTGVDLSEGMLDQARQSAEAAGAEAQWIRADAADYRTTDPVDAVVCLCEGAFCLLGSGDDPVDRDLQILQNVAGSLQAGGGFVLTALSACRMVRRYGPDDVAAGRFDPVSLVETSTMEVVDAGGAAHSVVVRERGYVAGELRLMCRTAGLTVEHIWGGTAGNWGRRPLDLDEIEVMVVARKP